LTQKPKNTADSAFLLSIYNQVVICCLPILSLHTNVTLFLNLNRIYWLHKNKNLLSNGKNFMADTPQAYAGSLVYEGGKINIVNSGHDGKVNASERFRGAQMLAQQELRSSTNPALAEALQDAMQAAQMRNPLGNGTDGFTLASQAMEGNLAALANPKLDKQLLADMEAAYIAHAPQKLRDLRAAHAGYQQIFHEVALAERAKLEATHSSNITHNPGEVTGQQLETAIAAKKAELDAVIKQTEAAAKAPVEGAAIAAAKAAANVKKEFRLGDAKFNEYSKGADFPDAVMSSEFEAAANETFIAAKAAEKKVKAIAGLRAKIDAAETTLKKEGQEEAFSKAWMQLVTTGKAAKPADADVAKAFGEIETMINGNAEAKAALEALNKVAPKYFKLDYDLHHAKNEATQKLTKLEGATEAELIALKAESAKALEALKKDITEIKGLDILKAAGFWQKNYGIVKNDGVVAALKHNFGGDAWKNRKMGIAVKGAGTVVGLGLVVDAVGRGQSKGAEDTPQDRSALARVVEAVVGLGAAAGFALHGGR
jgi:hypothetical protein